MPANVTIKRSFGSLEHLDLATREDMRQIGLLAREQILRRTLRGVDVEGQSFAPYSEGYAHYKRQALGTDAVNLQVSGNMLNDLGIVDIAIGEDKATVTLGWIK